MKTPSGDLIAFLRTAGLDDHLCIARSTITGAVFQKWEDAGFQGNPFLAMRLPDGRALLVYGYRHPPFGFARASLDAECRNVAAAPEVILRDTEAASISATHGDDDRRGRSGAGGLLFNRADGPRTIESTLVSSEIASKSLIGAFARLLPTDAAKFHA